MMSIKLLIVDDDQDFADAMAEYFEIQGYPVDVRSTGKAGIEAIKQNRYDVVFLDVGLPDQNGCDVCMEMRRIDPSLRCYLLTGYSADQLPENWADTEAVEIMTKPIDPEELAKRIASIAPPAQE